MSEEINSAHSFTEGDDSYLKQVGFECGWPSCGCGSRMDCLRKRVEHRRKHKVMDINTFKGSKSSGDIIILKKEDYPDVLEFVELRPIEIHLLEKGSKNNNPSLMIMMVHTQPGSIGVIGQVSLEMFERGLSEIGYKIVKI